MVRAQRDALRILRGGHRALHVLGDVDHDRTRLAVGGDVERLGDDLRDLVRVLHEEAVLGDGAADAVHVRLLECVCTNLAHGDLSRDAHERDAVHVRGGETCDGVCGTRSARHEAHAGLAGGARIAVGHVHAALLVPSQHELERGLWQAVEYVQHRAAGISEQHFSARFSERIHERLGARSLILLHLRLSLSFCISHALAARSPRAALDLMRHSMAFLSSGFTPKPFS